MKREKNVDIAFRTWGLETYPNVPQSQHVNWNVKSSFTSEKPRYIILAFQTGKQNAIKADRSKFDHVKIKNVKIFFNSDCFPYGDLNVDFASGSYMFVYQMFSDFQRSFYGQIPSPTLEPGEYASNAPLLVFDVSRQDDQLKSGVIDLRIELTTDENLPANTNIYAMIIHDRLAVYNVHDKIVKVIT